MTIRQLDPLSSSDVNRFIKAQWNFYTNDANWAPPLVMDRKKLLDVKKNPFYKHAKIALFVAERGGEIIGRIAGITNENHNKTHHDKVGFFGFFECVNEQAVANALFDKAKAWVKSQGMDTIRGPVNPSMNDEVGLLIDGFDSPAVVLMTYNPPYYQALIENAGLAKSKDLLAYWLKIEEYQSEKLVRLQNAIRDRYQVTIRNINLKDNTQFKKDIESFKKVYNIAWEKNWGFVKITDEEIDAMAGDLKMIADPELVYFIEVRGELAGMFFALPDINQINIRNKSGGVLGFLWHLFTKKKQINACRIITMGVLPEYRKSGLDAVMYYEIKDRVIRNGYHRGGEASWILEDNVAMNQALTHAMNAVVYKTYRVYDQSL
jgi:GNAT superfamily N-acetyltransferase